MNRKVHTNGNTSWFVLSNKHVFSNLYDMQYTTQYSTTVDAMIKAGCTSNQIYIFFQNIGINVYEEHIILYLKYGVTLKEQPSVIDCSSCGGVGCHLCMKS